ncbi:MAG: endonuclease/exonuclease/phosphatase family protein [Kofleriaceae bacterium]|nr:endonuclease/exonuclease/phosphatase family protein [Kofleriaceae bacterium]
MSRRPVSRLLLPIVAVLGCSAPAISDEDCGESVILRMMSYNLANEQGEKLDVIAAHIINTDPDFIAVQECACTELLDRLPDKYQITEDPQSGVTIVYNQDVWLKLNTDFVTLGQNDDGWGDRVLHWARFSHRDTGHCVNVYSTHFCVPIRNTDDQCDEAKQLSYLDKSLDFIQQRQSPMAPSLFAGDFNVFVGFEDGEVVRSLKAEGFVDTLREFDATDQGPTFRGNSWAPAGRIDYIFATSPSVDLLDGYVDRESVPDGQGSDHFALISTLRFSLPR